MQICGTNSRPYGSKMNFGVLTLVLRPRGPHRLTSQFIPEGSCWPAPTQEAAN
jgi:hypothetical protein